MVRKYSIFNYLDHPFFMTKGLRALRFGTFVCVKAFYFDFRNQRGCTLLLRLPRVFYSSLKLRNTHTQKEEAPEA